MTSGTSKFLYSVWGSSGSDVFAVGDYGTILHYDGSTWSSIPSGTTNYLLGIWGSSGSDVFVVGDHGTILHYDGTLPPVTTTVPTTTTVSSTTISSTTTTIPPPLTLIEFNAIPGNRMVTLNWSTASEIYNAGFNLYRSTAKRENI